MNPKADRPPGFPSSNSIRRLIGRIILAAGILHANSLTAQTAENFPYGISLGSNSDSYLYSVLIGGIRPSTILECQQGGIALYAPWSETARGNWDGGVHFFGKPISMVLGADNELTNWDTGTFDIWRHADYWSGGAQAIPAFRIDTASNTASFNGLSISVAGGTLSVSGSPVITETSAQTVLEGQGFVHSSSLENSLNGISVAPNSTAWTSAFLSRGNVSNGAYLAFGESANASGLNSTAIGYSSTASGVNSIAYGHGANASGESSFAIGNGSTASGSYGIASGVGTIASGTHSSVSGCNSTASGSYSYASGYNLIASGPFSHASGYNSTASGIFSLARGNSSSATGFATTAIGWGASAKARVETVFGNYNLESNPTSPLLINGLYGLFRIGNGTSSSLRSDALTVLWAGQTTLTNKEWKNATVASPDDASIALADPASTTDSGGNALVVDGHTVLNGKVVISIPQGDISMGNYQ